MKIFNILKGLYLAFVKNDQSYRYLILERISNKIYPFFCATECQKYYLDDMQFLNDYKKFDTQNFRSVDRKYLLVQLLKLVKKMTGDVAECGVFKGATSFLILKNIDVNKTLHLFDTFEGLSKPGDSDGNFWTEGSLSGSEQEVVENLKPYTNFRIHKGYIPDKFGEVLNVEFSFVHIDVDLYQPTYDSLDFFVGRLQHGGMIVCDDSGFKTCPGARKAMIEIVSKYNLEFLDLPTGQGLIIKQ